MFLALRQRLIEPTEGSIVLDGEEISKYTPKQMRPVRKKVQMVFQDPYASLNPRMSVRDIVAEPLIIHGLTKNREETDQKQVQSVPEPAAPLHPGSSFRGSDSGSEGKEGADHSGGQHSFRTESAGRM